MMWKEWVRRGVVDCE
jgi:hypothetical protein